MDEFKYLKECYISAIRIGMLYKAEYNDAKRGNELLHSFCEMMIDNSKYSENDKRIMKDELRIIKELLSQEIDLHYGCI